MVIHEIQRVLAGEELHKPLNKVLERLIPSEKEYGGIVQELIAILPSEDLVNDEVTKWAAFQQQILGVTLLAKQQISIQSEIEDSKRQLSTTSHANSVSSHLRLPKFTLSEFTGNIIQWVSWWDQYKICIHENETLTDRDRFNYLRMYVKGSARRAIEYIEVSGNNYPKAIEALQRRYGRKRLIVEHLVESLLNIEKKDKVEARSLRGLYDVMVSRYRTLEAYEPKLAEAQRILVPILQSKFPDEIRRKEEFQLSKLENEKDDRLVTVEYLFDFLRSHVMSEEATDKSASKPRMSPKKTQSQQRRYAGAPRYWEREPKEKREEQDYPPPFSATALNADSKGKSKDTSKSFGDLQCADCSKEHHITNCSLFAKKSVGDKLSIVKEKGLCFNCLLPTSPSHYSINCRRPGCPVERCKKKHHRLLHHKRFSPCKDSQKQETDKGWEDNEITSHAGIASGYLSTSIEDQVTLLPTGVVKLVTPNATLPVRVLVDSGSDQSYIRGEIVEALGLDSGGSAKTMMILMHGGQSRTRVKKANFQVSTRG